MIIENHYGRKVIRNKANVLTFRASNQVSRLRNITKLMLGVYVFLGKESLYLDKNPLLTTKTQSSVMSEANRLTKLTVMTVGSFHGFGKQMPFIIVSTSQHAVFMALT